MTAGDLNHLLAGPMGPTPALAMAASSPYKVLADDELRYVGDPYAMVLATSRALAEDATELIELDCEPLPAVVDYTTALAGPARVHPDRDNVAGQTLIPVDDELGAIFETAPHVVRETFVQNRYLAVPMETRGIVAWWDPRSDRFEVWVSTQSPHDVRTVTGRITGVAESKIRVRMGDVGGGFGQKAYLTRDEQIVLLASYGVGKPVKWIEDRRENLVAGTSSRAERCTVTVAAAEDGKILGLAADHLDEVGAYPHAGSAAGLGALMFPGPYRVPKFGFSSHSVFTNTCPRAPYRGPWQFETYFREQALDSLARKMGLDPLELRRRNVVHRNELPYTMPSGVAIFDVSPEETLEQAAAMVTYEAFLAHQQTLLAAGRLVGIGIGLYIEPQTLTGRVYSSEPAHIRIQPNGSVDVYLGSGSHGQGLETTTAQLVSEHVGVAYDDVTVHQGDTSETPYAFGTGGSRSGPILGAAIQAAALELRAKVAEVAAHLLEAAADDLEIVDNVINVRGTPAKTLTVRDVAHASYFELASLPPGMEPGLEVIRRFRAEAPFIFSNACHLCTVEIDPATGQIRILRYIVSEDCGVMINPSIVEGQIAGGAVQGIGGALLEDFVYDADGTPLTTTFLDYLLPTAPDVPTIEYGHIETPASTPGHFKGVGEGGAIGAPAAVANAINNALAQVGAHVAEAPFTPARIIAALAAVRDGA